MKKILLGLLLISSISSIQANQTGAFIGTCAAGTAVSSLGPKGMGVTFVAALIASVSVPDEYRKSTAGGLLSGVAFGWLIFKYREDNQDLENNKD